MRAAALLLAALLAPGVARAHAFSTGRDAYGGFLEGAAVVLSSPGLLLPLLALALTLTLWHPEGLLKAWPAFLAGSLAGVAAGLVAGPWMALAALGVGLVLAFVAALVPPGRIAPALPLLAGLTGLVVLAAALEGHGWAEVALATRLGILFGAQFALAASAGVVRLALERAPSPATTILWRVTGSWLAAILVLYLALSLRG